jgi:hypothetical protein
MTIRFSNLREHGASLLNQLLLISVVGALYNFKEGEKKRRTKKNETQRILGKAVSLPGQ